MHYCRKRTVLHLGPYGTGLSSLGLYPEEGKWKASTSFQDTQIESVVSYRYFNELTN